MIENRMMTGNRVDCLYRVSTDKQVDYNDKSQADIPMQRRECHRFCEKIPTIIIPLFGRDCKDVAGAIFCRIVGKGR